MATIITRAGKGTPLTNAEVDTNFTGLNTELGSKQDSATALTLSGVGTLDNKTLSPSCNVSGASGQPVSFRNLLVNATFQVNNGNAGTPYVSGAALAAGTYGHEMWKAGASGGAYSFTQNPAITTITIAAGKSLVQVIEDKFVEGGAYVLSWTGTAQARVTINSATPSGSFASSPILVTGQTAGTTMCVEVNTGTLSKAQLEVGSIATKFEFRQDELQRTRRYAEVVSGLALTAAYSSFQMKETKRVSPAISLVSIASGSGFGCAAVDSNSLYQSVGNSVAASFNVLATTRL